MSTLDDRTTELLARPSLEGLSFALAAIREAMARGAAETPPAPGRKSHAARVAAQGATHPQGEAA